MLGLLACFAQTFPLSFSFLTFHLFGLSTYFFSLFQIDLKIDVFYENDFYNSYVKIILTLPEIIRKPHQECNRIC